MEETTLKLRLFGTPTVEQAGRSVALPFERRSQLVVLLALRRGWVPRAELAALLWPDQPTKQAYTNLRKILFRLQGVPWAAGIESQGAALRLQADTDVRAFEAALHAQRGADALAAYRGELLAGFDDGQGEAWTQWLAFERERLRVAWRAAALARLAADDTPAAEAVALSAQLLEADPLDEAALRAHMGALASDGQTAAARQVWRRFTERLQQDLGIEPGAELRALHDALGGAAPVAAAPPAGERSAPPDDGFVGRSVELRRIADLLGGRECRLLCLVGPGGMGKTRLARRALALLAPQFADGGHFVALEDIDTPAQFGLRLAQVAGAARERGADALARAVDTWRDSAVLLLLDNFEPLAEHAAALLEPLLQGCPKLKILLTTRVRLAVAGDWSMPVEGLPCPDPEDGDRAGSFDAVRLFVKAAQRVEPGFAAAGEGPAIVDICRQVDGLPLALELAAAWVRVLPCSAIADELRQGSELLRTHDASQPARHASIEVVFEHSWQRLSRAEREALARLAVFGGGFTVEAARAVAGASLPVLGALADKSLLAKSGERMHLHPLVQQMAALRLAALPHEQRAAAEAHARHFHRLLAHLAPGAWAGEPEALRAVEADFENARRAWLHALATEGLEPLAASAVALTGFCEHRGRFEEALELLASALATPAVQARRALEAALRSLHAHVEYRLDRYDDARGNATRALQALRQGADAEPRLLCLLVLGRCALQQGDPKLARVLLARALALSDASRDPGARASVLGTMALVERVAGAGDEALALSVQVLAEQRRLANPAGEAASLNTIAALYLDRHDYGQAAAHLKPALALCDRHGLVTTRGNVLSNLVGVTMALGDNEAAEAYAERALEHARGTGNRSLVSFLNLLAVPFALQRADLDAARRATREALQTARAIGKRGLQDHGLRRFAEVLQAQGETLAARRVLRFVIAQPGVFAQAAEEFAALLDGWGPGTPADWAWPGLDHAALVQRVVDETELAHAPLIAQLRAATTN